VITVRRESPIVAMVSSVGGLDAVGRVLRGLPADLPAAVIALQHTDPARVSHLAAILDRTAPLPVTDARDGAVLAPGRVVVAPSGFHTLVTRDRTVALVPSGRRPPYRPSADLLLATLAAIAGPEAIAVVLSGFGSDGAAGVTAVKRLGGTVIASDLATSQQTSMPEAAIDTGQVDHVLPLDDIARALVELTAKP
jgi:two-component system, chemotaxis family, protein-glutamate methylesterase/glutaminase